MSRDLKCLLSKTLQDIRQLDNKIDKAITLERYGEAILDLEKIETLRNVAREICHLLCKEGTS
jgi:hypothetical protein